MQFSRFALFSKAMSTNYHKQQKFGVVKVWQIWQIWQIDNLRQTFIMRPQDILLTLW